MKIIGLDVGSKTIGVAVSDAFGWTAQGLTTIKWDENDIHSADTALKEIITEHEIGRAVIGLPKNMNGTIGERGKAAEVYAEHVEETHHMPTALWDERRSTIAAERKKVVDKEAAVMILEVYLDPKGSRGETMGQEEKERIILPDENGEEHLFEVLFRFDVDETKQAYIALPPVEQQANEEVEVYA